jgi:hypothetical protein
MKEIFSKVGIGDVFAYLCPGALLLGSFLLWVAPDDLLLLKAGKDTWQSIVLSAFVLILSYMLGLIVAMGGSGGAALYLRKRRRERYLHLPPPQSWLTRPLVYTARLARWVYVRLLGLLWFLPEPRIDPVLLAGANTRMASSLSRRTGPLGLSNVETPWDWLALYRTAVADGLRRRGKAVLAEADAVHRRFLFSQGVALAAALLAAQALARLVLGWLTPAWDTTLPAVEPAGLVALLVLGFFASLGLRYNAGRCWEMEFVLTANLAKLAEHGGAAGPAGADDEDEDDDEEEDEDEAEEDEEEDEADEEEENQGTGAGGA